MISYDSKCERLANYFLADYPKADKSDAEGLAIMIQMLVEDYLEFILPGRIAKRSNTQ